MKIRRRPYFDIEIFPQRCEPYTAADFHRPFVQHRQSRGEVFLRRSFRTLAITLLFYAPPLAERQIRNALGHRIAETMVSGCPLKTLDGKPVFSRPLPITLEASVDITQNGFVKVSAVIPYPDWDFLLKRGPGLEIVSVAFPVTPANDKIQILKHITCDAK